MTTTYLPSRSQAKSLTAQIRYAEHQVLNRQQRVKTGAATLARNIHQQMTAPATLLLASGIGFIVGELTKCQNRGLSGTDNKNHTAKTTTPLRVTLALLTTVRTLYTALPLAWMIKSFYRPTAPSQTRESKGSPKNA